MLAVAVVVPVHNEEALLPRCLTALAEAISRLRRGWPRIRIETFLVLDSCIDASATIAARYDVNVMATNTRSVGSARGIGAAAARTRLGIDAELSPSQAWLACTDADSAVPSDWLTRQISAAERGADLVLGRVRPYPEDLEAGLLRAWAREHLSTDPTAHVHGANLGVRWDAFERAGGFEPVEEHEDVLLVNRLLRQGARVAPGREVLTSGRRIGRVPGGFSGYLRALERAHGRQTLVDSD